MKTALTIEATAPDFIGTTVESVLKRLNKIITIVNFKLKLVINFLFGYFPMLKSE